MLLPTAIYDMAFRKLFLHSIIFQVLPSKCGTLYLVLQCTHTRATQHKVSNPKTQPSKKWPRALINRFCLISLRYVTSTCIAQMLKLNCYRWIIIQASWCHGWHFHCVSDDLFLGPNFEPEEDVQVEAAACPLMCWTSLSLSQTIHLMIWMMKS